MGDGVKAKRQHPSRRGFPVFYELTGMIRHAINGDVWRMEVAVVNGSGQHSNQALWWAPKRLTGTKQSKMEFRKGITVQRGERESAFCVHSGSKHSQIPSQCNTIDHALPTRYSVRGSGR